MSEEIKATGPSESRKVQQLIETHSHPAQWVFALLLVLFSFWLLSNLGEQVKFPKRKAFVSQPGFWPAIALGGMCFFATCFLIGSWVRRERAPGAVSAELLAWLHVVEYPLWFLGYVWLVPQLGYLPSTVLFSVIMTLRLGYKRRVMYFAAVGLSAAVVVLFKAFLEVKIPGGELYSYLPEAIRNFMILKL
ncbi:MAG: tripartite tricarboxylate transporter TctB family protein [Pseudomonadales bacterium]